MFDKKSFGVRIRDMRVQGSVSQQLLADHLNVSKQAVSMMESGRRAASADILVALADYFDVSLDYLVGRSDDPARH